MGLISKATIVKGLFNASSEESLHISENSEPPSEDELPPPAPVNLQAHPPARRHRLPPVPMSFIHMRRCIGKKKARRYQDVNHLMTLVEEDEFGEVSITDLAPCNESQFARLLGSSSSMAKWNEFASSSEEAQHRLVAAGDAGVCGRPKREMEAFRGEDAYLCIDKGLRSVLRKGKVPLGLLSCMENLLVEFFTEKPLETYVSKNLSSFERLLLHAISQYYQLFSQSFNAEDNSRERFVKVVNPHQDFRVPDILLRDFLDVRREVAAQH